MSESIPFRQRGHEVTRLEAFSDVVFGFALTLIVVSLEVPTTFSELMETMRGFPAFAICFSMLTWIWYVHHTFFRRYAMTDDITIVLNALLLFVVLFYTYPLKFMFSVVTGQIRGGSGDAGTLFIIYGLGFFGIFLLFVLMHGHALLRRRQLELTDVEVHDTWSSIWLYGVQGSIGLLSAIIAANVTGRALNWAGWAYFLLGPLSAVTGYWRGSKRARVSAISATNATSSQPT